MLENLTSNESTFNLDSTKPPTFSWPQRFPLPSKSLLLGLLELYYSFAALEAGKSTAHQGGRRSVETEGNMVEGGPNRMGDGSSLYSKSGHSCSILTLCSVRPPARLSVLTREKKKKKKTESRLITYSLPLPHIPFSARRSDDQYSDRFASICGLSSFELLSRIKAHVMAKF